jgi:hypothetical protein
MRRSWVKDPETELIGGMLYAIQLRHSHSVPLPKHMVKAAMACNEGTREGRKDDSPLRHQTRNAGRTG